MVLEERSIDGNGNVKHSVRNLVRISGTTVNLTTLVVGLYGNAYMSVHPHVYTYTDAHPHTCGVTYTFTYIYTYIYVHVYMKTHTNI